MLPPGGSHFFVAAPGASNSWLDAQTGKTILQHPDQEIHSAGFPPGGKQLALAFVGETQIRIFDAATARQTATISYESQEGTQPWIQFSPNGDRFAISYEDTPSRVYGVSVYDLTTKKRIHRITGHAEDVNAAYFLPDGRRIFTKSTDGTVRLWDMESGIELLSLAGSGFDGLLPYRALSPNGRIIAIGGSEGVYLKQAATDEQVAAWQQPPKGPSDTQWWRRLGGIQDWLVLAPFRLREKEYLEDLDKQQLADEADLDPSAGDEVPVSGEKLTWKQATTNDCVLDFQKATSPNEDNCLAYAVTHIYSDAPREKVRLLFGSDDLAKVYLNGKFIHSCRSRRAAAPADDEVWIDLRKGKNVLVCKVIDDKLDWGVSAQVVGEDYQPIPGVTTEIRP